MKFFINKIRKKRKKQRQKIRKELRWMKYKSLFENYL